MKKFVSSIPFISKKSSFGGDKSQHGHVDRSGDDGSYKKNFTYTKNTCALSWWEPICLLEEGSISDIHLVRRRERFVNVKYKDKRDVMDLAKRQRGSKTKDAVKSEELYVLKSIMKDHIGNEQVLDEMRSEILTMSKLSHPNICRIIEAYERRRHIYLVMEFCSGGNLAGRIPMTEIKAAHVTAKILSVVKYLHDNGVAHRDIKLENIMFDSKETIKLIDFGLANAYLNDDFKNMTEKVGTLYSMAPEVLNESYDQRCDLWSVGVVTYLLLSGIQPFWGPKKSMPWAERRLEMIARIKRCEYASMNTYAWENISGKAKSFVKSLLKLNPDDRPSPQEALNSEWIRTMADSDISEHSSCDVQVDLKPVLRNRLVQILSTKLSESEILGFLAYLENNDEEGDGLVSMSDLFRCLNEVSEGMEGLSKEDVRNILHDVDSTGETFDETMKLNYIDLMVDVLVGKGRNLVEAFAAALDAKSDESRMISVPALRTIFDEIFPLEMSEDLWDDLCLKSDNETMVNTSNVLESVTVSIARHHKRTIHSN
ncbi:hypothetical protein HJC23_012174 [Cyclotella cryptica]|uniref:Protein kinase domain-containing protein n=1 Tax=Cyclotella cryptica TaxID=29204 RepID=A0ABD3P996_9STRA|eukprot:CCRYP_016421-RA/>CCRYP_016421-RA protein AED:0.02 eAED:0.02 QI:455/1/1/1/1/1/2/109/540